MTFFTILRLLLSHDLWEQTNGSFDDELQLKDGDLKFFSNEATRFRNKITGAVVYSPGFLAWLIIFPLSHRLKNKVVRK